MVLPASANSVLPVMIVDKPLAQNSTTRARSSGVPSRPKTPDHDRGDSGVRSPTSVQRLQRGGLAEELNIRLNTLMSTLTDLAELLPIARAFPV